MENATREKADLATEVDQGKTKIDELVNDNTGEQLPGYASRSRKLTLTRLAWQFEVRIFLLKSDRKSTGHHSGIKSSPIL